ncbi:transmembrane emp24 domain-containing protein p24delta9 [Trifolium repens]|nr:transmembrane emp24 domain-containing protein p24delta9 [Trifolium repens]
MVELKHKPYLMSLLVLAIGLFSCVQSIKFDLPSGPAKCFTEDIKKYSMTFGKYSIVSPNEGHPVHENHTLTVRVTTQGGSSSHHVADHVQSGQFAFVSRVSGDYLTCFWADASNNPQVTLSVDFEWKTGVAAKETSLIAKKSKIDRMTYEIQLMQETAKSIKEEMSYLLHRAKTEVEVNECRLCRKITVEGKYVPNFVKTFSDAAFPDDKF